MSHPSRGRTAVSQDARSSVPGLPDVPRSWRGPDPRRAGLGADFKHGGHRTWLLQQRVAYIEANTGRSCRGIRSRSSWAARLAWTRLRRGISASDAAWYSVWNRTLRVSPRQSARKSRSGTRLSRSSDRSSLGSVLRVWKSISEAGSARYLHLRARSSIIARIAKIVLGMGSCMHGSSALGWSREWDAKGSSTLQVVALRLRNYLSVQDENISLGRLNVLIGTNASGKQRHGCPALPARCARGPQSGGKPECGAPTSPRYSSSMSGSSSLPPPRGG